MKALLGQLDAGFMEIILDPARVYVHKNKEVGKVEGKKHVPWESQSPGRPSLFHLGWYHSGVRELQGRAPLWS